jgi:hypothetical protein
MAWCRWAVSFYIRYILTDHRAVTAGELEQALRQVDPTYAIDGDLIKLGAGYGIIDIAHRGDPICDGDLDLLARLAEKREHRDAIVAAVWDAKSMVCVQPVNSLEARTEEVLAPLWDWLLANRAGLLAWEGGTFFGRAGELK